MNQDIAIAHEKLLGYGGAQHVAFHLARTFDAPIYAGWKDETYIPDDVEVHQLFSERSKHLLKGPVALSDVYHMLKWQHVFELYEYDTVIVNKPNCSWFVPRPDQTVVYYAHHPPRATFDRWHRLDPGIPKRIIETIKRTVYRHPLDYPDVFVANSEVTAHRFERYLNIEIDHVVHPPVEVQQFDADDAPTDDYLLTLGRLEPNKRVGGILEAVDETGDELIVAGDGSERTELESMANGRTRFVGDVSNSQKRELMAGAKGFVFNAEQEDFGITPIEAMAAGTPVIGVDEGNTSNQIEDGYNGILFERGELADAIDRFDGMRWNREFIEEYATRYSVRTFRERMREVVDDT